MQEAYRQVRIRQEFRNFLGFSWYGRIYRYTSLPFGLSSAPKLYSEFAELQRQIIINSNIDIWKVEEKTLLYNYLDDFWSAHSDFNTAWLQFADLLSKLTWLGIPTQWKKVHPPSQRVKLLGFMFDLKEQRFFIPRNKVVKICEFINDILSKRFVTRREMSSIKGVLCWCSQVIRPSKAFLRGFDYYINNHRVGWDQPSLRLSSYIKEDLLFWKTIVQSAHNGLQFKQFLRNPTEGDIHVWTDAAIRDETGIGGYATTKQYFQVAWNELELSWPWPRNDSSGPELLALVAWGTYLATRFSGHSYVFHCDNAAVVAIINHEVCAMRKQSHMGLVRYFISIMFQNRCKFWITHIPGERNIESDSLSRFKPNPLQRLYQSPRDPDEYLDPYYNNIRPQDANRPLTSINLTQHTLHCLELATYESSHIIVPDPTEAGQIDN